MSAAVVDLSARREAKKRDDAALFEFMDRRYAQRDVILRTVDSPKWPAPGRRSAVVFQAGCLQQQL
jgi:hypothetical protein